MRRNIRPTEGLQLFLRTIYRLDNDIARQRRSLLLQLQNTADIPLGKSKIIKIPRKIKHKIVFGNAFLHKLG